MATMRVAQISRPNGPFELVERPIPEPGAGWVRIKVQACGVCHSDTAVAHGLMPVQYPRVPGHEVAGVIDALGPGVTEWAVGDRVGAGWHGGYCGVCPACRQGEFLRLPHRADHGDLVRRRVRRIHAGPDYGDCPHSGRPGPCRRSAPALRRHHHLQRPAE